MGNTFSTSLALTPASTLPLLPSLSSLPLVSSTPRSYLAGFARNTLLSVLENAIQVGSLSITEHGVTKHFGQSPEEEDVKTQVHLNVISEDFWGRVLLSGDLGFSEAYMIGEVEVSDLKLFFDIWLDNKDGMASTNTAVTRVASMLSSFQNGFSGHTKSRARLNAVASYDQSNELYMAFLSKEMMYSVGLWSDEEGGIRGDLISPSVGPNDALERAQQRKLHHICKALRLFPGARLLEFGSGWGGLAIFAATNYGAEVDSLTLSKEQVREAKSRAAEAERKGLIKPGSVRFHLSDYRECPAEFEGAFDAFVSSEMIEHVGPKYYHKYFSMVDWALKPQRASAVVTSSTFPEHRFSNYQAEDFCRRYVWPNCALPSASSLITAADNATRTTGRGGLTLVGVENHSKHYPRTLREWSYRLRRNLTPEVIAPSFPHMCPPKDASPAVKANAKADFDVLMRLWLYLFAYAGAGFNKGYITVHMLNWVRGDDGPGVECY